MLSVVLRNDSHRGRRQREALGDRSADVLGGHVAEDPDVGHARAESHHDLEAIFLRRRQLLLFLGEPAARRKVSAGRAALALPALCSLMRQ